MAASREVSISVQLDDGKSEAAFKRIKARFEEIGDVSDKAIRQASAWVNTLIVDQWGAFFG